jgi:hypothetical protein
MTALRWDSFEEDVTHALPSMRSRHADFKRWWGEEAIPQHVLVGDVVIPFLVEALSSGDESSVEAVLSLIEDMAIHADERIAEVAGATFVEYVASIPELRRALSPRFGAGLRRLLEAVQGFNPRWRD